MNTDNEHKFCPRCSDKLDCQMDNISICSCSFVKLSEAVNQYIAENYTECLCVPCLIQLNKKFYLRKAAAAA